MHVSIGRYTFLDLSYARTTASPQARQDMTIRGSGTSASSNNAAITHRQTSDYHAS
jgi:hypothetical protein